MLVSLRRSLEFTWHHPNCDWSVVLSSDIHAVSVPLLEESSDQKDFPGLAFCPLHYLGQPCSQWVGRPFTRSVRLQTVDLRWRFVLFSNIFHNCPIFKYFAIIFNILQYFAGKFSHERALAEPIVLEVSLGSYLWC